MFIRSYEYLGKQQPSIVEHGKMAYVFRELNSNAEGDFQFTEQTLDLLHDLPDLIDYLARIQRNGPGRAFAPDAS